MLLHTIFRRFRISIIPILFSTGRSLQHLATIFLQTSSIDETRSRAVFAWESTLKKTEQVPLQNMVYSVYGMEYTYGQYSMVKRQKVASGDYILFFKK